MGATFPFAPFVVGGVLALGLVAGTRALFDHEATRTTNHRGNRIPVGVGVLLPLPLLVYAAACAVAERTHHDWGLGPGSRVVVLLVGLGFALLGLLDDLLGSADGAPRGFRGHLRELASGRLGTGSLKLLGGGAVALVAAGALEPTGWVDWLVAAAIVALAANAANLFDRAPGRCTKVALVAFVAVWLASDAVPGDDVRWSVAAVVGAAVGTLWGDLGEQFMLGDAGSNALGAVVGLAAAASLGGLGRAVVLTILVVLNVAGELTSFSRIIEATPPLRWLDRLGRRGD